MLRYEFAFVAAAMLSLRALPAHGEPAPERAPRKSLTVSANVLSPFFGVYYVEANVPVSSRFSLIVNANHFPLHSGPWLARTTAAGAGVNYNFQGTAPRGWHVEAIAEALFASWRHEGSSDETSPIVVGSSFSALAGYRFVCDAGPVLDLGLGLARIHIPSGTAGADGEAVSSGAVSRFYPAPKINIGWAF
jgi:hypothetical protein